MTHRSNPAVCAMRPPDLRAGGRQAGFFSSDAHYQYLKYRSITNDDTVNAKRKSHINVCRQSALSRGYSVEII